ncbi:MAG: flagellar export chaperone FliS [Syntrophomonadaceae bacterium]|nr:flagellar export chaperone FliS [Syntrophomonadaceae bacterium]
MNGANAYSQYRQTAVQTSSPEKLLLMLYDGAIKFLNLAISAIEENDTEKRHNNLVRVQAIMEELMGTLNMDYEISKHLDALYEYFNRRLLEANIKNDKEIIQEVLGMVGELRDTWFEASKAPKPTPVAVGKVNVSG